MSGPRTDIEIVTATAAQAADVHRLISELARTTGLGSKFSATVDDYLACGFGANPMFETLLAKLDGVIVGVALYFYTFSSWRGEPGVYLQDLAVTESARSCGIGERLMLSLARTAGTRGATHLRLAVDHDNLGACRFYERCGMTRTEEDFIYEIDGAAFARMGVDE